MVSQTQVLPPFWGHFMVQKMKYRPKYAENDGHFEIQDGRHGDKWKKWQQFDLHSWVSSPSFKTKKSNCPRTSHKYQFRHISNQTRGCENCIERNNIVQIQRNNSSPHGYILSNLIKEDLRKTFLSGTGILTPKWQMRKFLISILVEEMYTNR